MDSGPSSALESNAHGVSTPAILYEVDTDPIVISSPSIGYVPQCIIMYKNKVVEQVRVDPLRWHLALEEIKDSGGEVIFVKAPKICHHRIY